MLAFKQLFRLFKAHFSIELHHNVMLHYCPLCITLTIDAFVLRINKRKTLENKRLIWKFLLKNVVT